MELALYAPWLQTLDFLQQKCPAGVRPLLPPSVADPAFDYSLAAAALVWGGPWQEPPAEAAMTAVQQIRIQAAIESAELLLLCVERRHVETPVRARTPLAPRVKEECQRLLGFLKQVGLCRACACGTVRARLGAAACVQGGASTHARCCRANPLLPAAVRGAYCSLLLGAGAAHQRQGRRLDTALHHCHWVVLGKHRAGRLGHGAAADGRADDAYREGELSGGGVDVWLS